MNDKGTPPFFYALALLSITAYVVFLTTNMARTPRATRVLWLTAAAVAVGIVALAIGSIRRARHDRREDAER
jgi:NADPH-dependent curcumin reductase CurA